jgi:hypothetical protein
MWFFLHQQKDEANYSASKTDEVRGRKAGVRVYQSSAAARISMYFDRLVCIRTVEASFITLWLNA